LVDSVGGDLVLFNSYLFWVFMAAVLGLFALLRGRARKVMLVAASYLFYGYWDWRFLGLIFMSTVTDYVAALLMASVSSRARRRLILTVSVAVNLGILGFFKYADFFIGSLASLLGSLGVPVSWEALGIILPVGISFYTFQTMSYTIDVYRGEVKPTRSFLDFMLYVSFFPQLVAGPIERASHLLPQIISPRHRTADDFRTGAYLILVGLFKKVVIADNMAAIANAVFSSGTGSLTGLEVLVGVYAFAFQIYGDFAGYSSIARGVGRWLGYDFMVNFRMPYLSVSPADFWRRWHISLSSWLRDYLYIPLGGNRSGAVKTYRNLALTMLLGGLWHGAAWTFVAWGAFHGLVLILYRVVAGKGDGVKRSLLARVPSMVLMFHLVCLSWLLFRAESIHQAYDLIVSTLSGFGFTPLALGALATIAFFVIPLMVYEVWIERTGDVDGLLSAPLVIRSAVYTYLVVMIILFPSPVQYAFIYFQF
jgi:D-alanyl-lipoteichoic acid acyltransferase DltB (MBOAT superfamily)